MTTIQNSLTASAAYLILSNITTSYVNLEGQTGRILDINSNEVYGYLNATAMDNLLNLSDVVNISNGEFRVMVAKDNKKTIKHLKNKFIIPEGMVKIPHNIVILDVGSKIGRVADAVMSRLIPSEFEDIVVNQGTYRMGYKGFDWHVFAFTSVEDPDRLRWAVRRNDDDAGYAFLCETQKSAFEKLIKIWEDMRLDDVKKAV